jgi:hypothetical protein
LPFAGRTIGQRVERRIGGCLVAFARSLASFSSCWLRTEALSTFRMSIFGFVRLVLVDADNGLLAGVDARLRLGGRFLDAHFRNAGLDGLGHAAQLFDLGDVLHRPAARSCVNRSTKYDCRPKGRSPGGARFLLQEQLRVAGDAGRKSVGRASASSSALVCSDCVWPCVAAIASTQVRITLL